MTVPVLHTRQAGSGARGAAPARMINPVTGYGLAIVISAAVWALLLSALF